MQARDAAGRRKREDPRTEKFAASMPLDGKRLIHGGFARSHPSQRDASPSLAQSGRRRQGPRTFPMTNSPMRIGVRLTADRRGVSTLDALLCHNP
jgi:hypothetical protein